MPLIYPGIIIFFIFEIVRLKLQRNSLVFQYAFCGEQFRKERTKVVDINEVTMQYDQRSLFTTTKMESYIARGRSV